MSTTVLGKRTRSTPSGQHGDASSTSRNMRAKRRAVVKKEDSIPIFSDSIDDNDNEEDAMAIDTKEELKTPTRKRVLQSSPTKVNSHFKIVKTFSNENRKPITVATPSTPRHRDRLQKPVTPRHRVALPGQFPRTPKTPANRIISESSLFNTPTTPSSRTIFTHAKNLFVRSTMPGQLVGRDVERKQLSDFLSQRIQKRNGGCLYVSGPPGTGKSALLTEVLGSIGTGDADLKRAYVNCMTMKDPKGIYAKLSEEFLENEIFATSGNMVELEELFVGKKSKSKGVFIVVLDEIDHLLTKDQEILYKIFEWSFLKSSRLILIGIANALDLTDRFLPRLKARNYTPTLLPILPYSATQIAEVVTARLRTLNDATCEATWVPMMHPAAITLCSKKVASSTGDLRKCFDICRKAVEMVEQETKTKMATQLMTVQEEKKLEIIIDAEQITRGPTSLGNSPSSRVRAPLGENSMNICDSPSSRSALPTNPMLSLTASSAPRATLAHIARISASSFGVSNTTRLQILNLQQKAVITALIVLAKKTALGGAVSVRSLWESYRSLCTHDRILTAISRAEFGDVLSSLEGSGVVEIGGNSIGTPSKKGRNTNGDERRIRATVREEEVKNVLNGDGGEILMKFFSENA